MLISEDFYAFLLYVLHGHALSTTTPALGVMKFTTLEDSPKLIITILSVCQIYAWE